MPTLSSTPGTSSITDASLTPSDKNATPSFTPDAAGEYRLSLAVKDSAGNWSSEVFVKLTVIKPNDPPVADAGPDQEVIVGEVVYLNSSASYDTDGTILAWQWNASTSNPSAVTLVDATLPEAYFITPSVTGEYLFELKVRDDKNAWSEVDTVSVNVTLPDNEPPVAVAPNDFVSTVLKSTKLNGSASYDPDGEIVEWDWNCTSHPSLPIMGADTEEASFVPALAGLYNFTLTVRDDRGAWSADDTVSVTVQDASGNVPPVAVIAGKAVRDAYVGDDVFLDGSPSSDEDGTIVEYIWNCTSHPSLSFTGQNTTVISFRPEEPGDYVFNLFVEDDNDTMSLSPAIVTVQVTQPPVNSPPVARIDGPAGNVRPNDVVVLDGSRSSDRDGIIMVFNWRCVSHPTLEFTGQNTSFITVTFENVGDYTFSLSVQDNLGAWSEETAYIAVNVKVNVPPVAAITGPSVSLPGRNITLSAATSSDEDGEVVAWRWNCTSHPGLYLNGTENETMTFMPSAADTYEFGLVVQDDEGEWSQVTEWTVQVNPVD